MLLLLQALDGGRPDLEPRRHCRERLVLVGYRHLRCRLLRTPEREVGDVYQGAWALSRGTGPPTVDPRENGCYVHTPPCSEQCNGRVDNTRAADEPSCEHRQPASRPDPARRAEARRPAPGSS